jgi:hypothetical protein
MKRVRRIPHLVRFLAAFACAGLGLVVFAPAAFAMRVPAPGDSSSVAPTGPHPVSTHTIAASGMSGWQITMIIAVVAVLAAAIAIAVDRSTAARRTGIVAASEADRFRTT